MAPITRTFPLEQLKDWDVPHADDTEIQTTDEWCVFRAPDDGLIYRFYFSPVFADYAEMDWYDDMPATVSCDRVEKRTRTVVIDEWVPVAAEDAPVPDPTAEVHVTFDTAKPGQGKSQAAAEMARDAKAAVLVSTLTWRDLNFRDEVVVVSDGRTAQVVGVRSCVSHAAGDAQLRFPDDAEDVDPLWYPVAGLIRSITEAVA